jgi:phosphatidylserine/phosphatidylglycerophosphate/cardiolipin synthase-like enzyme
VRVILDPREHEPLDRMAGLDVRMKAPGPLQHLKSFVIDGATLRTGSANFSRSGEQEQDNDRILFREPSIRNALRAELWAHVDGVGSSDDAISRISESGAPLR